jgi:hypothetical protein
MIPKVGAAARRRQFDAAQIDDPRLFPKTVSSVLVVAMVASQLNFDVGDCGAPDETHRPTFKKLKV